MITADEILDAVKKGGMSKWRPASEIKSSERIKHKQQLNTEAKCTFFLAKMGNKAWTVNEMSKETGEKETTVRDYFHRLVHDKKIKKSAASQPHKFFRI